MKTLNTFKSFFDSAATNKTTERAVRVLCACRRIKGKVKYNALALYYSNILINHITRVKAKSKELDKIQILACPIITETFKRTHTKAMELLLGHPPLYRQNKSVSYTDISKMKC